MAYRGLEKLFPLISASNSFRFACWLCGPLFVPDLVRATLGLPADWEPQGLITLGHPARKAPPKPRAPLETKVKFL